MRTSLTRKALAGSAAIAAVVTLGSATAASADPATPAGTTAVNNKRASLDATLRAQYFTGAYSGPNLTNDGIGAFRYYTGSWGEGTIYWSPPSGAHEIHGDIEQLWKSYNYETGLGYPVTDESGTPDGIGRYNFFYQLVNGQLVGRSSIYWSPNTGAHAVYGDILAAWASKGYEAGKYGYPVDEEHNASSSDWPGGCPTNNRTQNFSKNNSTGTSISVLKSTACWNPSTRVVTWKEILLLS
jgi:hypothetical protein